MAAGPEPDAHFGCDQRLDPGSARLGRFIHWNLCRGTSLHGQCWDPAFNWHGHSAAFDGRGWHAAIDGQRRCKAFHECLDLQPACGLVFDLQPPERITEHCAVDFRLLV
jgi:hypothetical protein